MRKGRKEDLPQVLALIRKEAEEARTIQYLTNTVEQMEKDGLGKHPLYSFFVAEAENKIIGLIIYQITYAAYVGKCIHLDNLVVDKQYRQRGVGRKLFEKVIFLGEQEDIKLMSWQAQKENSTAIEFYKKFNAGFDTNSMNCWFAEEQIKSYK